MPHKSSRQRLGCLLFFLATLNLTALGQSATDQILFLRLKLENDQVSMVNASVAPGILKTQAERFPSIELEVATASGQGLWTNKLSDPAIRRFEYEDPSQPGKIIAKVIQLTNVEFTVRVPVITNAYRIDIYRALQFAETNSIVNRAQTANLPPIQRRLLGTITLPEEVKRGKQP